MHVCNKYNSASCQKVSAGIGVAGLGGRTPFTAWKKVWKWHC